MEQSNFWAYNELSSKTDEAVVEERNLWNNIQEKTQVLYFKKGDHLIKKSDLDTNIYVVISGGFECNLHINKDQKKLVWFFLDSDSDVAVAFDSYLKNVRTKYNIVALEDSTVIKFEKDHLEWLRKEHATFNDFYIKQIMHSFFYYFEIRNNMLALSSFDFLIYLQNNYPLLVERVSSHKLASFMGITPEWLSKLKRKRIE